LESSISEKPAESFFRVIADFTYIHTYMHACMHARIYTYTHTQTDIHTHLHTHIHTNTHLASQILNLLIWLNIKPVSNTHTNTLWIQKNP